jgi:hypothetical protein
MTRPKHLLATTASRLVGFGAGPTKFACCSTSALANFRRIGAWCVERCETSQPPINLGHAPDRPDVIVAAMSADDGHVAIGL